MRGRGWGLCDRGRGGEGWWMLVGAEEGSWGVGKVRLERLGRKGF